jgi:hypothetical protein
MIEKSPTKRKGLFPSEEALSRFLPLCDGQLGLSVFSSDAELMQ